MIYEPKQKNKAPDILLLAFFICGSVCYAFSGLNFIRGRGILQGLVLVFFCGLIYVAVKYKFTRTRYVVRPKEADGGAVPESADEENVSASFIKHLPPERLQFVVEKQQGRRGFVSECILSGADIVSFTRLSADGSERKKTVVAAGKIPEFKYLRNIVGAQQWLLTARGDSSDIKIIIEADDGEFTGFISEIVQTNRIRREKKNENADE